MHEIRRLLIALLLLGSALAWPTAVLSAADETVTTRSAMALRYEEDDDVRLDLVGSPVLPGLLGRADVEREAGRTRVRVRLDQPLPHPQSLGPDVTTYVLWAVTPEGAAESLAELRHGRPVDVKATTAEQSFALLLTGEPHAAVRRPGTWVLAENRLRESDPTHLATSLAVYRSDQGAGPWTGNGRGRGARATDFSTPLTVLGARLSVEMARLSGAERYADAELRQAETRLGALEELWPSRRRDAGAWDALAHDVMRLGEHARSVALDRAEEERLAAERRAAAQSQVEADRARTAAERARFEADEARTEAESARSEAEAARRDAERAKAEAAQARTEAAGLRDAKSRAEEEARAAREAAEAERLRAQEAREKLFDSLSAILETRREARGLIVSLSDVLFDFDQATLKPGARERLSKLSGVLLAYPSPLSVEVEGHTDSVGSGDYNLRLSRGRAQSVADYLRSAGLPGERFLAVKGLGEGQPVASNETAEGRQRNRRVEIVIHE